jgi:hypothetical protein
VREALSCLKGPDLHKLASRNYAAVPSHRRRRESINLLKKHGVRDPPSWAVKDSEDLRQRVSELSDSLQISLK